jgi:hypothetical protein
MPSERPAPLTCHGYYWGGGSHSSQSHFIGLDSPISLDYTIYCLNLILDFILQLIQDVSIGNNRGKEELSKRLHILTGEKSHFRIL